LQTLTPRRERIVFGSGAGLLRFGRNDDVGVAAYLCLDRRETHAGQVDPRQLGRDDLAGAGRRVAGIVLQRLDEMSQRAQQRRDKGTILREARPRWLRLAHNRRETAPSNADEYAEMPKFYFNIDSERPDTEGVDLPDRKKARSEAIRAAGEILRDIDGHLTAKDWVMVVKDESGEFVLELRFSIREASAP